MKPNEMESQRIQVLRGIAICAVILIHTNAGGLAGVLIRPHVNFCVALFIFLSGFLTQLSYSDWKQFFIRRIFKVLLPYILWTTLYTIINRGGEVLRNLLTGKAAAPLYFILVYIQFVLLTPCIGKLLLSRFSWIGWLISPITIIVTRYVLPTVGIAVGFPFPGTICLPWFVVYYLGLAIGNRRIVISRPIRWYQGVYLLTLTLSTVEGLIWYHIGNYDMATTQIRLTSIGASVCACYIAALYIQENPKQTLNRAESVLSAVGDVSFGMMLIHILVMRLLGYLAPTIMVFPIHTICTIVISFYICYLGRIVLGKHGRFIGI